MIYSIAEAKQQFSELVKQAAYGHKVVAIGARRRPQAALIAYEELERLQALEDRLDAQDLETAIRRGGRLLPVKAILERRQGRPARRHA